MGRNRKPKNPVATAPAAPIQQPDWFPYDNTTYYNPALLSPALQEMIRGGGINVETQFFNNPYLRQNLRTIMNQLGLDLNDKKDCQIYADFISTFVPRNGTDSRRYINHYPSYIEIENYSFSARTGVAPEGTGYAMVARQVAAAQEIAKRTGKMVKIRVEAVNNPGILDGVSVWPKLGYDFLIPDDGQRELIQQYGFTPDQVYQGTTHFMLQRNAAGQLGFDVWRGFAENSLIMRNSSMHGETNVFPDGRETPALHITREYGKRRGFVKSMRQPQDLLGGRGISNEDDAILRDIWIGMNRGAE